MMLPGMAQMQWPAWLPWAAAGVGACLAGAALLVAMLLRHKTGRDLDASEPQLKALQESLAHLAGRIGDLAGGMQRQIGAQRDQLDALVRLAERQAGEIAHRADDAIEASVERAMRKLEEINDRCRELQLLLKPNEDMPAEASDPEAGYHPTTPVRTNANGESGKQARPLPSPTGANGAGPLHRDVLRLYGQGVSVVEIARRTDADIGKVELILNLRQAGRSTDAPE